MLASLSDLVARRLRRVAYSTRGARRWLAGRSTHALMAGAAGICCVAVLCGGAVSISAQPDQPAVAWMPGQGVAESPSAPDDTVTLSGTGDIIMGSAPGGLPPNDGRDLFKRVRAVLRADVQMGNLEQPLTHDTGFDKCARPVPTSPPTSAEPSPSDNGCFAFRVPPTYANVLADAGFKVMNLANNHSYDFGVEGYRQTKSALEAAGVKHTGAPGQITVVAAKGLSIAVVGFAPYGNSADLRDIDGAVALVKRASTMADLVVIQMQAGAEGSDRTHIRPGPELYLGENRGDSMAFAHAVIDAGADLIIGHGPHVMRGMEFYKGRLIAYSLGNFTGYQSLSYTGVTGVGGVLTVRLRKDGSYVSGRLTPTRMVAPGVPTLDPRREALSLVRSLSDDDLPDTGARIGPDGAIAPR